MLLRKQSKDPTKLTHSRLMLAARREERLKKLCEECKKLGAVEANYVVTDVTVEQQIM